MGEGIEIRRGTKSVREEHLIEYVELFDDVVVYRLRVDIATVRSGVRKCLNQIIEGFTSKEGLNQFLDGDRETLPRYESGDGVPVVIHMVSERHLDLCRTHGWIDGDAEKFHAGWSEIDAPLTALEQGASLRNVVGLGYGSNMVFELPSKKALPCAILFGDLEANMHNRAYDLEKAVAILQARDDIRFVRASDPEPIYQIPHYNAGQVRTRALTFVWEANAEDYQRMWIWCLENRPDHPSTAMRRAAFELDIFGLRAGGAAKYTTWDERVPVSAP